MSDVPAPGGTKILFLTLHYPPESTGNAPYAAGFAEWLAREAREPVVVTTHPHYPESAIWEGFGEWKRVEKLGTGTVTRVRHYVPGSPSNLKRMAAELTFGIRSVTQRWRDPDVVVSLSPSLIASSLALARATLQHRPFVLWVQDIYSIGLSERDGLVARVASRVLGRLERLVMTKADKVVVIHERFAAAVSERLGIDAAKIEVIRNWSHVPADTSFTSEDRDRIRARLGWGSHETVVLHAGNQGVKQGLELLIDLAKDTELSLPTVRFVLLGKGNQHTRLVELASQTTNVSFIDPLPDREFHDVMRAADVLAVCELPQSAEAAVPSKLTSYFAAGRPVLGLLNSSGITHEELSGHDLGLTIDSSDAHDIARLFAEALDELNSGTGDALVDNGLRFVREELNQGRALGRLGQVVVSVARSDSSDRSSERRS